jgi:hypothetical protein
MAQSLIFMTMEMKNYLTELVRMFAFFVMKETITQEKQKRLMVN